MMIIAAELVLTIQLVVLVKGIMILGAAFKEKNLANKIGGFILVIGTAVLFTCTMCHMVKYHKHGKHGFRGHHGKKQCEWAKKNAESYGDEKSEEDDD
jgi:hypothetical protein